MKNILLCVISVLFIACGGSANKIIEDSTSGNVNVDIKPQVVFKDDVTQNANSIIESSGEITINNEAYHGKYTFSKPNVLLLLNDEPFSPKKTMSICWILRIIDLTSALARLAPKTIKSLPNRWIPLPQTRNIN